MARVHCLDCATDVVVDPQGLCPSGHHLGVSGERVDEAIGSHTPHPDEPEPWVGRIEASEVAEAPEAPAVSAPMPQTAPGLAPAAPPPVDTQDLFAELGALGEDEPGSNGHGPAHAPAAVATPAPATAQPADAPEPRPAPQQDDTPAPWQADTPAPWQSSPAADDPEPPRTPPPAPTAPEQPADAANGPADAADEPVPAPVPTPVRSVPAGGPEAREALSEISALEAAVRSLTEEVEGPAAHQPPPEERMFAAPPPPPPAPSAAPAPAPAPRPSAAPTPPAPATSDDEQDPRRTAFADVAALGFEPEASSWESAAAGTGTDVGDAPEPVTYEQPQAAGAEGQPSGGLDTMNFTAKGGRMRRSDQPKRRLFGR